MAGNPSSTASFEPSTESRERDASRIGMGFDETESTRHESTSGPLTEKLGRVAERIGDRVPELKDYSKIWDQARDGALEVGRRAREIVNSSTDSVSTVVRRHPVPALLVGFTVGGLLGLMVSRWNRSA